VKRQAIALVALIGVVVVGLPLVGHAPTQAAKLLAGRVHASFQPEDGKVFVLVIGTDARSGNPDRSMADAIHIVGVNTRTMKGGILNFPRDSWVSIPGYGGAKINEALMAGGPELLARTLENLTGITIDYWTMTGFDGFVGMIDELYGVKIDLPRAIYDPGGSGASFSAGRQWMAGEAALSYVRTRKAFSGGDVTRTTNQGRFLLALLGKLRGQVSDNPAALLKWIAIGRRWTRFDISNDEMFHLGVIATQVKPRHIRNVTVPVSLGHVGAASVVFISPSARTIYARFREHGSL